MRRARFLLPMGDGRRNRNVAELILETTWPPCQIFPLTMRKQESIAPKGSFSREAASPQPQLSLTSLPSHQSMLLCGRQMLQSIEDGLIGLYDETLGGDAGLH